MSKNKNRKRNAEIVNTTGRITDKPKRTEFDTGHVEILISGPKRFFREDDAVHIVAFKLNKYRNSVPLTTAELRELREKITAWLGDGSGMPDGILADSSAVLAELDDLRARVAYLENEREVKRVAPFKPNTDAITTLDVPDTENYADAGCT